ncbi:PH domain-containing protein [Brachybacterium sp. J144]|uniref:PH domain-containing protein n=1 Tax=Brachybacterium sp. J144 TaxID=3116487 RepID=UPI002E7A13A0|nr:PH domain-containing protein [Brachybacterium sp. J144]MEE1649431.1 PH domain-containing protein [Brachybacterium sp. J144]
MSTSEPAPERASAAAGGSDPIQAPPSAAETPRRRTHPITPLVTGWKVVVGIIAVATAQNISQLVGEFDPRRLLIGLGLVTLAIVVAVLFSTLSWWFTTYAVDDDGVSVHRGVISRSREYAPRARIESVSVERPLLARILGLAKVRVEVAGGGESSLDIEYVSSARAEELRLGILQIAAGGRSEKPATENGGEAAAPDAATAAPRHVEGGAESTAAPRGGRLDALLHDGVTDGELIARIPTERLVRSLLRDLGFLTGVLMSILGVAVAIGLAIWQEGFSPAILLALLPTVIAVPRYVFGRIDAGWGFVSRDTDRGLRMRRGLLNTRTDNIAAGRIQGLDLRRPVLWRAPGWTAVTATVAGIDEDDENGPTSVLPVGTRAELRDTLRRLSTPLGTADDLAVVEHLLTAPARSIEGLRAPVRWAWIARRTRVTVLLPGALVHRSGILARRLEIVPRERIQQLSVGDDPIARRLGILDLTVRTAGDELTLDSLPRAEVLGLHATLAADARTLRRYRDRDSWPQPLVAAGAVDGPAEPVHAAEETGR